MWDTFAAGVAVSTMRNSQNRDGENEFAEMEYLNITVVTSNEPFGISDSSNPFFYRREVPRFNLTKGGVHSGHVQTSLRDPLCLGENGKGRCEVIFLGPLLAMFCTSQRKMYHFFKDLPCNFLSENVNWPSDAT